MLNVIKEKFKTKQKSRNQDINVMDMDNYAKAKAVLDLESDKLDKYIEEVNKQNEKYKEFTGDLFGHGVLFN